jgi:hypothetical protein
LVVQVGDECADIAAVEQTSTSVSVIISVSDCVCRLLLFSLSLSLSVSVTPSHLCLVLDNKVYYWQEFSFSTPPELVCLDPTTTPFYFGIPDYAEDKVRTCTHRRIQQYRHTHTPSIDLGSRLFISFLIFM